jgi:hypothetical protein
MTTKMLIVRFLDVNQGISIASHTIQKEIPEFAFRVYGKMVNPETISRAWREMREDTTFLKKNGYSVMEDMYSTGKEKKFIIRRISEVHRNSQGKSEQTGDNNSVIGSEESHRTTAGTL